VPGEFRFLHHYEFLGTSIQIFITEVSPEFDSRIVIGEGEGGLWICAEDAMVHPKIILEAKVAINDMERVLLHKPIR
jgi:hypothetical protein